MMYFTFVVPTGVPQSLSAISVNATSITIQWSAVACEQRNGIISGYQVIYADQNVTVNSTTFTANSLLPRRYYTFSVRAVSLSSGVGLSGNITIETVVSKGGSSLNFINVVIIIICKLLFVLEVNIVFRNEIYNNNSIVTLEDIGERDEALFCYTNSIMCCENDIGWWYLPNGTTVDVNSFAQTKFYTQRGSSVVQLNRRKSSMPTGMFRCEIPNHNGTFQNIYVGVYSDGEGAPTINDSLVYSYDKNQKVECNSSGGPATVVIWRKNGHLLDARYDQYQIIISGTSSKYQNILLLGQQPPGDIVGSYTCHVENSRGEDNKTTQLYGELYNITILLH